MIYIGGCGQFLAGSGQFLSAHGQKLIAFLAVSGKSVSANSQNLRQKMAGDGQENPLIVRHVQGVPVYKHNPSVPDKGVLGRSRKRQIGDDHKGMVINNGTGEILGAGGAVAYEFEEVDAERFVKLFLEGLKQAAGLSKSGLTVFEMIYDQVRRNPNTDEVKLNYFNAAEIVPDLTERTYRRGLRELLDKEFLFRSQFEGVFFVNIRYMFNGDRLAFVKSYKLKGSPPDTKQLSLLPPDQEGES